MTSHRVVLTGGTGFVGGNVACVLAERGDDVLCAVRRDPGPTFPWPWAREQLTALRQEIETGRSRPLTPAAALG